MTSNPDDPMPHLLERLRRLGKRLTPQRRRILAAVVHSGEHLDIEQIRQRVGSAHAAVSTATVYRTMRLLVDEGLLKERHFGDSPARYEYVDEGEHHDHLICTACGQVTEFHNQTIEELQVRVAAGHGYRMTGHKHEIYGLCRDCR